MMTYIEDLTLICSMFGQGVLQDWNVFQETRSMHYPIMHAEVS